MTKQSKPKSIPPSCGPRQAISLLQDRYSKAHQLLANRPLSSADHGAWENTTREFLIKAFGSDSENISAVINASAGFSANVDFGEHEWEEYRASQLKNQIKMLESCIEQLRMDASYASPSVATEPKPENAKNPRDVLVVHGRNEKARRALFAFLCSVGLNPLEWSALISKTEKGSPYVGEILDAAFNAAQAAVVLFTGDDLACLGAQFHSEHDGEHEAKLYPQARPNVLFEAGMALGRKPTRTILVELGKLRPFSDISGIHVVRLSNRFEHRQDLINRLRTAGCPVDQENDNWKHEGDFDAAIEIPQYSANGGSVKAPVVLSRSEPYFLRNLQSEEYLKLKKHFEEKGFEVQLPDFRDKNDKLAKNLVIATHPDTGGDIIVGGYPDKPELLMMLKRPSPK